MSTAQHHSLAVYNLAFAHSPQKHNGNEWLNPKPWKMTILQGGRAAHNGQGWGIGSGEGPSVSNAPRHSVKIHNHHANQELDVEVPEDRSVSLQVAYCANGVAYNFETCVLCIGAP